MVTKHGDVRENAAEAADPYCLRPGEAAALLRGHPWRRFVVVGDSIAEGLGEPSAGYRDSPWADRIAEALRAEDPSLVYRNLGTRNLPAARVRESQLAEALAVEPNLALVACGGYDILRPSFDPDAVDEQIAAIISALRACACDVVTVGMFDVSHSPHVPVRARETLRHRLRELADRTAASSERFGGIHFDLTGHPASTNPDLYGTDGRHGTARSHAIAAAECVRRLGAHLGNSFTPTP